jgi:hypothetical protein
LFGSGKDSFFLLCGGLGNSVIGFWWLFCAELVKRLRTAGKDVKEALAEIKSTSSFKYMGHGPLHLAVLSAKPVMCKYLLKDLKLDVNAGGVDGNNIPTFPPLPLINSSSPGSLVG